MANYASFRNLAHRLFLSKKIKYLSIDATGLLGLFCAVPVIRRRQSPPFCRFAAGKLARP